MGILAIVAFVQIVLESLPVSSSGHIRLLFEMCGCCFCFDSFIVKNFYYFLHGPTFLIFFLFFAPFWIRIIRIRPFIFFFIAEIVTFIGYFFLSSWLKGFPLSLGFMVTLVLLFCTRFFTKRKKTLCWSTNDALLLGVSQVVALVPGISRMGTVFFMARWLSYSPSDAFAIAGILDIPLALGGFLYGMRYLYQEDFLFLFDPLLLGVLIVSSCLAIVALFFVYYLVRNNRLWWLSWYMLLPLLVSLFV